MCIRDSRYAKAAALAKVEDWEKAKLEHMAETLPAMIHIISDDPDGLKGINQKKVSEVGQKRYPIMKPIQDKMANKYQWCIAAVPGKKWAKKIFPELRASTAMEKLWESILYTSRADGDDPVEAWNQHNLDLRERCDYINSLGATELRYHSSNAVSYTHLFLTE